MSGIKKITSPICMAQNECKISQNLNEIDDDNGNKKVQLNWCPGNQTKFRGTVTVKGCDRIFMEGKAEISHQPPTPRSIS